jgi:hypothetical protein
VDFPGWVRLGQTSVGRDKINPFLRDDQVGEVVRRSTTFSGRNLIENNQQVLRYLLENTPVSISHDTGQASPAVGFVVDDAGIGHPIKKAWSA